MKIEPQRSDPLRALAKLVDGIDVAMLTTRADGDSMVARPLEVLKLDAAGEFVFFTAIDSHKVAELDGCTEVNLAFADPRRRRFVSVRGSGRVDRDRGAIDELWTLSQQVFFPRGRDDPHLAVLHVRVRDAAYWEPAGGPLARAVDFVRGLLSRGRSDLGRPGSPRGRLRRRARRDAPAHTARA